MRPSPENLKNPKYNKVQVFLFFSEINKLCLVNFFAKISMEIFIKINLINKDKYGTADPGY
jgi:hypothetical protein